MAMDMFHYKIIPDGVLESIAKADGRRQRNSILHDCLLRTCTNEALMRACGIITSVQGNPKMSALGKDMQRRLESGVCVCVCVVRLTFHCIATHECRTTCDAHPSVALFIVGSGVCSHQRHVRPHTTCKGSSRFGCEVSPDFMFSLWSHCYHNLLRSSTIALCS